MATLHSSPFSIRLIYDLKVYPLLEGNEWHFYYIIEPLLYGQPFLRPKVLKRWKQPHGTFSIFNAGNYCEISTWLKAALHGGKNNWCSLEPPELEMQLLPATLAIGYVQLLNNTNDQYNLAPSSKQPIDEFSLQWIFQPAFFTSYTEGPNCVAPFVIQQSVTRQQLEHFIEELEKELKTELQREGLEP
jgi:hypothetical protein